MITRRMNTRITFFALEGGQNENGEVLEPTRRNVLTCWAEVSKTTLKDFRKLTGKTAGIDNLVNVKDSKVFLIRWMPDIPFDNSMYIDFNGLEYQIENIEVDFASKEMIMVSGVRVS